MSKSTPTYFKNSWLSENDFSEWLFFSCTLSLSNMGRKALTVHMTSAGHKNKRPGLNQVQSCFYNAGSSSSVVRAAAE